MTNIVFVALMSMGTISSIVVGVLSDSVVVALIGSIPSTTLGAMVLLHQIVLERKAIDRAAKAEEQRLAQSLNIQKIETATNSMKDALVKATKEAAIAEGVAIERSSQEAITDKIKLAFDAGVKSEKDKL